MATSTERFGFTKPAGSDPASVVPLNSNTDLIELYLGRTQDMIAPLYDDTATYDVGDIVTYESNLYKCITAISTAETFDPTKWEATTAVEEGSGGGGGSSVIPNPTGTPTDTLSTIGIDGTIYGIEGGGSISGEGVEIYSESEYIVGKWIDGKKLYQKTIDFGAMPAQGNSKSVAHNISDIDKIISWEAFGVDASGLVIFVPNISRGNVASQTSVSADNINVNIYNGSSSDLTSSFNGYVTIRYTKTVETPAPAWGGSVTNNYAGFIDADNVIYSTTSSSTTDTYTATEDCYIMQDIVTGSTVSTVNVDGETVAEYLVSGTQIISYNAFLKKGQVLTVTHGGTAQHTIKVFGITYASGGSETPATDAIDVEYDNTTSQLTADNVQEAIDEVVANVDTASENILTLQNVQGYDEYDETQTYAVGDYAIYNNIVYECTTAVSTAEPFDSTKWSQTSIEQIIDGVKGDVSQLNSNLSNLETLEKTVSGAIVTFTDGASLLMPTLKVGIDPIQDLHGQDSPWAGGAGKNKLPLTVESIKTASDKSTWNNNSITINGITYEIQVDTNGNVLGIKTNGTASGDSNLRIYDGNAEFHGKILNGCPSNGSINTYHMQLSNVSVGSDYELGNGTIISQTDIGRWILIINIKSGTTVSNLVFKPMIRLASEQDATFAPYSNICPISGWDECNVGVSGVNVWDEEWELGGISNTTGQNTTNNSTIRTKNYIPVVPNTQYYINSNKWQFVSGYDADKNFVGTVPYASSKTGYYINVPSNVHYIRIPFSTAYGTTYNNDISINYPSTDTSYHAYNGQTYTVQFKDGSNPLTVYGGTLDVISGLLTVTDEYIASYNGETLPATWISDRDVYTEGTIPTTGAEVCYELATPQTYQLTPTQVKSLLGTNNVWADTGNIELTYLTNSTLTQTIYDMVKIMIEQSP